MKYNQIQNNFSSGELSQNLHGRSDIEEYFKGVAEMTNFLPIKQGGATFRPGTFIAGGEFFSSPAGALFEFAPRDGESYYVLLQPGKELYIEDAVNSPATITGPGGSLAHIWNERIDFTDGTADYTGPTNQAEEITHREIVDSLQVAQSGDVMIVVDGTGRFAPIAILRTAANTFVVDSMILPSVVNADTGTFWLNSPSHLLRVPYKDANILTDIRLKPSAVSGSITINSQNASAVAINFFKGNVVGTYIKITHSGATGVARITAKTSDSQVSATVLVAFGATTASSNFEVSAWNPHDGYPRSVAFFEGRLIFGGNKNFPDTIWCSLTGNIYHFMQRRLAQDATTDVMGFNFFGPVKATDPFSFIPASVKASSIQWLYPSDTLIVGTSTTEFAISNGQDSSFSLDSVYIKPISSHGSSKVQPVKVGSSILFVSADGKRVLEIPKRLVEYTSAIDFMGLSSGIVDKVIEINSSDPYEVVKLKNKIRKMAWNEADGVLWCLCKNSRTNSSGLGDSALISLTLDRTAKALGWAKHKIAQMPFISSIAVISDVLNPGAFKLLMFIRRSNASSYSLEYLSYNSQYDSLLMGNPESDDGGKFVTYMDGTCLCDNSLAASGVYGTVNADELVLAAAQTDAFPAGTEFGVFEINDDVGTYLGSFVESGGVLAVPGADTTKAYVVGVLYEGQIKTMPVEAGAQFGVAAGSPRRTHGISLYVNNSLGGSYKASKSSVTPFNIVGSKGTSDALYTGEIPLSLNASPDDHQIIIKQSEPYPLTISWLLMKGYTYDT